MLKRWGLRLWTQRPTTPREFSLLVAIFVAAFGLFGFTHLADEVMEGDTRAFDSAVLLALRAPGDHADPIGPIWVEEVARDVTALGSTAILAYVTLAVCGFLALSGRRSAALLVAVSIGGGALLSSLLKFGFDRPRPDLVPHAVEVYSASFPSGHAMLSAVTYLTLGALIARVEPRWRTKLFVIGLAVVTTFLVGVSRIYLGVHWPTDVLGGWCLGSAWAMACWLVALWLQGRGEIEKDVPMAGDAAQPVRRR